MPQLPSGRRVGLSIDPLIASIEQGNFSKNMTYRMAVEAEDDSFYFLVTVARFVPTDGFPEPGKPVNSGLMLNEIATEACDWSQEDKDAFAAWLDSPPAHDWFVESKQRVRATLDQHPGELPKALHGLLD